MPSRSTFTTTGFLRLLFLCFFFAPASLAGFFSSDFLMSFFVFLAFLLADFIALRARAAFRILGQRNEINPFHVAIDIGEFLIAKDRFEITRWKQARDIFRHR